MNEANLISRRQLGCLAFGGISLGFAGLALASDDPVEGLKSFFKGGITGRGQYISTVDGKPPRGMVMKMTGTTSGDLFTLRQDVDFSDGAKDSNTWKFRQLAPLKYIGERTKVDGPVPVDIAGASKVTLRYIAPVPTEDGKWMTVRFTDSLQRLDERRIKVNTEVSYFGITVGHGEILFQK